MFLIVIQTVCMSYEIDLGNTYILYFFSWLVKLLPVATGGCCFLHPGPSAQRGWAMHLLGNIQYQIGPGSEEPSPSLQLVLDEQGVRPDELQGSLPAYFLLWFKILKIFSKKSLLLSLPLYLTLFSLSLLKVTFK